MGKKNDDAKKAEEEDAGGSGGGLTGLVMKVVHVGLFCWFIPMHCGLMRHHMGAGLMGWGQVMILCELGVLVMHAVGLNKAAMLVGIAEMSGGHFQHFFLNGYPTVLEGILSTYPFMNTYLLSIVLCYLTAPTESSSYRSTFSERLFNTFKAMFVGCVATVTVMFVTSVASYEHFALCPVLYMLPGIGPELRRLTVNVLTKQ
uniref:Uncharacterized protein n=1 Tax=Alexandrium andersonii TaxID=327968 RepID=A0A7S2G1T4_9DINO|mmetsp:Transcript_38939/g.88543  ORF Transcript_38939/g.88543 Transcript_38939/m.88543 type:complete len:202 (+) Transcript_38939:67-672(+)